MIPNWWQNLRGSGSGARHDELAEVRAHLEALKSRGGPEIEAHSHCKNNRAELAASDISGCFYCCEVFDPKNVQEWVDSGDDTAICPKCGIDSVIGSSSGFPAGDSAFLKRMREIWF